MIDENAIKTVALAILSIFSYMVGEISTFIASIDFMSLVIEEGIIDIVLQRGARTVAMIAGIVAILNGGKSIFDRNKKNNKDENTND